MGYVIFPIPAGTRIVCLNPVTSSSVISLHGSKRLNQKPNTKATFITSICFHSLSLLLVGDSKGSAANWPLNEQL